MAACKQGGAVVELDDAGVEGEALDKGGVRRPARNPPLTATFRCAAACAAPSGAAARIAAVTALGGDLISRLIALLTITAAVAARSCAPLLAIGDIDAGRMDTPLIDELFSGPVDVVGDVHGELGPLQDLLKALGYEPEATTLGPDPGS